MAEEHNSGARESTGLLGKENIAKVKARLHELRNGEVPLAQTFWLYYFAAVFALRFLGAMPGPAGVVFNLLALGWSMWMISPVIKSANNYRGDKDRPLLAKIAAIVMIVAVLTGFLF